MEINFSLFAFGVLLQRLLSLIGSNTAHESGVGSNPGNLIYLYVFYVFKNL